MVDGEGRGGLASLGGNLDRGRGYGDVFVIVGMVHGEAVKGQTRVGVVRVGGVLDHGLRRVKMGPRGERAVMDRDEGVRRGWNERVEDEERTEGARSEVTDGWTGGESEAGGYSGMIIWYS